MASIFVRAIHQKMPSFGDWDICFTALYRVQFHKCIFRIYPRLDIFRKGVPDNYFAMFPLTTAVRRFPDMQVSQGDEAFITATASIQTMT